MKLGRVVDFFFVGFGVLPIALMLVGLPELMIILFIPLMLVACLLGMAEQSRGGGQLGESATGTAGGIAPREATGLTYRKSKSERVNIIK